MAQPVTQVREVQRTRAGHVRPGIWIELIAIGWMVIEAAVALSVVFATHSVSLQGFGLDSIVELVAGHPRLSIAVRATYGSTARIEAVERRATFVRAISLFALAIYIVGDSTFALVRRAQPEASW